ncbi:thiamine phosphate synthase [Parasphingorhabdus sp. JC815]|uniref:thiamine phosphate synthase n=1 Tax=Parasphingorhabdus sp. JC815 TaxID=3232140 RepID=UPI00345B48A8
MHQSRFSDLYPQSYPHIWLMTDARNDAMLEKSIKALPRGSGIVFRHYHLSPDNRHKRFAEVRRWAKRGGHILLLAGPPSTARLWGADGVHGRQWKKHQTAGMIHSAPVHDRNEISLANHHGADLFFLSPVFSTRSHPGQRPLSQMQLRRLVTLCAILHRKPVILLGGMNARRFQQLAGLGAYGWAAIDGLSF